jgi:hypothetical protein
MVAPPFPCPLCSRPAIKEVGHPAIAAINCDQCGLYQLTGSAEAIVGNWDPRLRFRIGFWTRDQNDLGDVAQVSSTTREVVEALPNKTVPERIDRFLRWAISVQKDLGGRFPLNTGRLQGVTHSMGDGDVAALANLLFEKGWLAPGWNSGIGQITPHGFMHASERPSADSVNGFIAMWFDLSMVSARTDGLEPAIRAAGYNPVVVSGVEHTNKIDDEIIAQIRQAKFLVADFTGHRGGVYFEAGFALGLGLPVFWTCRKDHLKDLHFDIRQYNCIDWETLDDLKLRLGRRINAVIGRGSVKSLAHSGT